MNPKTMEEDQIEFGQIRFCRIGWLQQLTSIFDGLRRETKKSSGKDSDTVRGVRRRKIRIVESDSEAESYKCFSITCNLFAEFGQNRLELLVRASEKGLECKGLKLQLFSKTFLFS